MRGTKYSANSILTIVLLLGLVLLTLLSCTTGPVFVNKQIVDVAVLQTRQEENDRLPKQIGFEHIDRTTTRLLGSQADQKYWAGYSQEGEICIIAAIELEEDNWTAGVGCKGVVSFAADGLAWVMIDAGGAFPLRPATTARYLLRTSRHLID